MTTIRTRFQMLIQRLRSGSFLGNVLILAGGTGLGQLVIILVSPILTRIYSPDDFGILAIFASMMSILAVISALRYEFAIPLPEKDEDAVALLKLTLAIIGLFSLFITIIIWVMGDAIELWTHAPGLTSFLWMLPLGLLGMGSYQALNYWAARKKQFSLLSFSRTTQALGRAGLQTLGGFLALGPIGLIGGLVAGKWFGTLSLAWGIVKGEKLPGASSMRYVARRYKNFPLFTAWSALINVIGIQIPPVLFARYFSVGDAGFFSLTMRVLGLPAALVGQAVGQVFYPLAADRINEQKDSGVFVERTATALLSISLPTFALVFFSGPVLFTLVFGKSWTTAGLYASYLSPWLLISFVSSPLSTFALAKEKQKLASLLTIYETSLRLGAIWLGGWLGSAEWAVKLFAAAGVIIALVYLEWVLHLSGSGLIHWLGTIRIFVVVAILLIILLAAGMVFLSTYVFLALNIIVWTGFAFWFVRSALQGVNQHV